MSVAARNPSYRRSCRRCPPFPLAARPLPDRAPLALRLPAAPRVQAAVCSLPRLMHTRCNSRICMQVPAARFIIDVSSRLRDITNEAPVANIMPQRTF